MVRSTTTRKKERGKTTYQYGLTLLTVRSFSTIFENNSGEENIILSLTQLHMRDGINTCKNECNIQIQIENNSIDKLFVLLSDGEESLLHLRIVKDHVAFKLIN